MKKIICLFLVLSFLLFTCDTDPVKVDIKKTDTGYQLYRAGKPYYIKGAGIEGHYKELVAAGGNSIRIWGVDQWAEAFAMAEKFDLTVCAGIWLEQERQGFDYSNPDTVKQQFERYKPAILKYKDHPKLLMWNIGNELDLNYTNPAVWDAVEEFAAYIHEVDGNHPTTTTTAFIEKEEVEYIKEKCPSIDLLCINAYAGLPVVSQFLKDFGWNKAYILGEWGTFGHWEVAKTGWNEPIEFTSKEKAELYFQEYKDYILPEPNCLGSYVFFWGSKQERTPTWYGMFLQNGAKTQAVDVMHKLWKNEWPTDRAPILDSLRIDEKSAHASIIFKPETQHSAEVWAIDPENQALTVKWQILHETTDKRTGGDEETRPPKAEYKIIEKRDNQLSFLAPKQSGAYRLFVYVYDETGNAAHANIPFFVK
ncbi:MAG: hypothetical protein J7L22_02600 [Candidatus Marinimicrobia bacterium]|nr:hypothetical protein [Candidatus Neomarinimicrobiota bacterium]